MLAQGGLHRELPLDLTAIKMSLILNHDMLWRIHKWEGTGLQPESFSTEIQEGWELGGINAFLKGNLI